MSIAMKDYKELAGAVIRIAIMIVGGLWFNAPQNDNSGGFGNIVIVPLMIIINIVLFIGAVIHIGYFFRSLKWDDHLKNEVDPPENPDMPAAYISEEPKELPAKKNFKALLGAVIQVAIIVVVGIWFCSPLKFGFVLPVIAICIGLSWGIYLCIVRFLDSLKE